MKARCSACSSAAGWHGRHRGSRRRRRPAGRARAACRAARRRLDHAVLEAEIAGLAPASRAMRTARSANSVVAEAELHAAGLPQPDIEAGALAELGGQRRPFRGRGAGPALVMRRAETLATAPRPGRNCRARRGRRRRPRPAARSPSPCRGQPLGDGGADQPAADHDRIEVRVWGGGHPCGGIAPGPGCAMPEAPASFADETRYPAASDARWRPASST